MPIIKEKKMTAHIVVMLLLQFGFRFLPPVFGLPEIGMQVLGSFIGTLYGWVFVGLGIPSVLGIVSIGMTDLYTMGDVIKAGFGNSTVITVLALFLIAGYVEHADFSSLIVNYMLSRKIVQGRPWMFVFFFFLAVFLVGVVSYIWVAMIFFTDFIREMTKKTDLEPNSKQTTILVMGVAVISTLSDICAPFKGGALTRISVFEAASGETINLLSYAVVGILLALLLIVVFVLSCKFIFRIDMTPLSHVDLGIKEQDVQINREQKTAVLALLLLFAMLTLPGLVPDTNIVGAVLSKLGTTGAAILVVGILMILKLDGKPLLDLKVVAPYFKWDILFLLAALFPIVNGLNSDAAGIKDLIVLGLSSTASGLPPYWCVFFIITVGAFITQFMNNTICSTLFISALVMMTSALPSGLNYAAISVLLMFATDISCWMPSANPLNAYGYAQTDLIKFKYYFRYGFLSLVIF